MTTSVASLDDVGVDFRVGGEVVHALRSASLSIAQASSTAILGRSGSGKSTLVSILALLRRPTSGTVTVGGRSISGASEPEISVLRSRSLGTVFQSFHLDPGFSAAENVLLPWYFGSSLSRSQASARAHELLDLVGIAELATRRPGQMSGGQRQRVAIARALFNQPLVLVADEPTGNLDEDTAEVVADVLFGLPSETGTAVVVVTHDTAIAARAGAEVHIAQGRLQGVRARDLAPSEKPVAQ